MSYILEALKKAQAERQLGSTPTIHASQLHLADGAGARSAKAPLVAALAGALLAAVGAAAFYLARVPAPAAPILPAPAVQPAASPAPAASTQAAATRVQQPAAPAAERAAQAVVPVPATAVPASAAPVQGAPVNAAPVRAAPVQAAVAPGITPPVAAAAPQPAPGDHLPLLRELPNGGAGIPKVELGGYIYSDNPADRLVVIDKELRKEGDQVAPGLVLERLGPAEAVMNYRGTRFRVPY